MEQATESAWTWHWKRNASISILVNNLNNVIQKLQCFLQNLKMENPI